MLPHCSARRTMLYRRPGVGPGSRNGRWVIRLRHHHRQLHRRLPDTPVHHDGSRQANPVKSLRNRVPLQGSLLHGPRRFRPTWFERQHRVHRDRPTLLHVLDLARRVQGAHLCRAESTVRSRPNRQCAALYGWPSCAPSMGYNGPTRRRVHYACRVCTGAGWNPPRPVHRPHEPWAQPGPSVQMHAPAHDYPKEPLLDE